MCRIHFIGSFVRLLLLVACLALSLFMPNMLVGLGIWPLIWLAWDRIGPEDRLSAPSLVELLPFAIAAQVALDSLVPYAGDVAVLAVNAMIVTALRRPKIPPASVVVRRR